MRPGTHSRTSVGSAGLHDGDAEAGRDGGGVERPDIDRGGARAARERRDHHAEDHREAARRSARSAAIPAPPRWRRSRAAARSAARPASPTCAVRRASAESPAAWPEWSCASPLRRARACTKAVRSRPRVGRRRSLQERAFWAGDRSLWQTASPVATAAGETRNPPRCMGAAHAVEGLGISGAEQVAGAPLPASMFPVPRLRRRCENLASRTKLERQHGDHHARPRGRAAQPAHHVRLRRLPARAGRDRRSGARRPRRAGGDADRQRQVAVLPAAGAAARRPHHRGVAADRADAQSGGAASRLRRRRREPELGERSVREPANPRPHRARRAAPRLCRARAAG